jgi:hypothetical protein
MPWITVVDFAAAVTWIGDPLVEVGVQMVTAREADPGVQEAYAPDAPNTTAPKISSAITNRGDAFISPPVLELFWRSINKHCIGRVLWVAHELGLGLIFRE